MSAERLQLAASVLRAMGDGPTPGFEWVETVRDADGKVYCIAAPGVWLARDEQIRRSGLTLSDGMLSFGGHTDPFRALATFLGLRRVLVEVLFNMDRGFVEENSLSSERFARDIEYTAANDTVPPYIRILYSTDVFPEDYPEIKRDYEAGIIGANQYEELPDDWP